MDVLFEETQRPALQWWRIVGAAAVAVLAIRWADPIAFLIYVPLIIVPQLRPMTTRLTTEGLRTRFPWAIDTPVPLDQIVRCEVIEYRMSFWHGAIGRGMEFPSQCVRASGNRGVRLDLTDGLHLLIGSQDPERRAAAILVLNPFVAPASACASTFSVNPCTTA